MLDQARLLLCRGERGRVRQGGERVLERAAVALDAAELEPGFGVAGLGGHRLAQMGLGLVEPGLLPEQHAQVVVGLGELRLHFERAAEARLGVVEAAGLVLRDAEIDPADGIVGCERRRAGKRCGRRLGVGPASGRGPP